MMDTTELKQKLFKQIELLDKSQLNELSGVINNLFHKKFTNDDWENLTINEKEGIVDSIKQLDAGGGILHDTVMKNIRQKLKND